MYEKRRFSLKLFLVRYDDVATLLNVGDGFEQSGAVRGRLQEVTSLVTFVYDYLNILMFESRLQPSRKSSFRSSALI